MKSSNLSNEALRQADVGQTWEERLTGSAGTLTLNPYQTFRVRAAAGGTVTIDGTLAATMISGEILTFNSGSGQPYTTADGTTKLATTVTVVVTGAQFVQVARDSTRKL